MSASLVGSEMCIRDRPLPLPLRGAQTARSRFLRAPEGCRPHRPPQMVPLARIAGGAIRGDPR
eukprot:12303573-Alexandrium_andersonii.AAC.1